MIEQVLSLIALLQRYFVALGQYISFNVKRLGALTSDSSNRKNRKNSNDKSQNGSQVGLKPVSEIPGPKCLPLIGSLLEFNKFGPRRIHELSQDRHEKYGDIFREKLLSQELVFVGSTPLLKQWMLQEGKLPSSFKQEPSKMFAEIFPNIKRGLFFRNGEEWFNLRKYGHFVVHKCASDFDVEGLFENCEEFLHDYVHDMKQTICDGGKKGVMVDLEDRAYDVALGATFRVVYGRYTDRFTEYTGTDMTTLARNSKHINICCQELLEMPARLAKLFRMPVWKEFSTKLHHNITSCITYGQCRREEIKKSPEACSMRTHGLLYKTMELKAPLEDIDELLMDFAVDSKDPFAASLMFITQVLSNHPNCQDKILEEVNQVYSKGDRITYGKSKYLDYTKAFVKEAIRLYPIAAFTARVALETTVVGDYQIPPGTMIMFSSYAAQRDPRYFSDPLKILPERWLTNSNPPKNGEARPTCDPNAFAAFGLNQRLCLGQNIAMSLFVMYIANFVKVFKLKTDKMPEVHMRTILYPKHPEHPIHLETR